ncbi:MAG: aldehyde ferredoxin oxidoreductase family protein [Deltaproteobacteria bacterium]|nr:aldehyde ferredoxin oxidoreductase family protein [Deltaproteobacteria bacterium]
MTGWMGNVLRVNLTAGSIAAEKLDRKAAIDFVGGRGLGIKYLLDEVDPNCDPLSTENKLIMATGPLTGTSAPTAARYSVVTKAPLTGAITCSNSGGFFPMEMKKTGFDMIIFEGKAANPVYLWIDDGKAELRHATHIWGKNTHETHDILLNETHPKARVACIGPAGEKLALISGIMNDKDRAAARGGVGAVMGSKNLKAVVVKGAHKIPLDDEDRFKELAKGFFKTYKDANKQTPHSLTRYGTSITITGTQRVGALPTRNCTSAVFEGWKDIGAEELTEKYLLHNKACFSCPIGCGRVTRVNVPGLEGEGEGPEYETIYSLGSMCGIGNLAAVIRANYICNEMGLDTISTGATIACAMELYERGILPKETIGRDLPFGDSQGLIEMCKKTGIREGFGEILSSGSYRLGEKFGHSELAMVAKKQEFAGYDPRGEQGMGLAYATSPIGASHMRGDPAYFEILGVPTAVDPYEWKNKPQMVKDWQDVFTLIDSAGVCVFFSVRNYVTPTLDIRPVGILGLLNAATGANYNIDSLIQAGERIFNAERLFLARAGFSLKDDTLPPRILSEKVPEGPSKGNVCHLGEMLPEYYRIRGWDENGIPTEETLRRLGLNQ